MLDECELPERDLRTAWRADEDLCQGPRVYAILRPVPHAHRES
jgi:hypothetical protein